MRIKAAFRSKHSGYTFSKQPLVSERKAPSILASSMRLYIDFDTFTFSRDRKKCILLEDSHIKYLGFYDKKSYFLEPKNPLKKDETIIDYDMDSEEEWNEQNGEDLAADNKQDEEEDDEVEKLLREEGDEEEAGFIVPDDYLSASELNLSQS